MAQKVIIDADPGIGDAVALAVAMTDPEIDVVGITATAGRVSGKNATRNIQAIVEFLDPPKWPRLGSSDALPPVLESPFDGGAVGASVLNGPSGLGDHNFRVAELHRPHESAKLMIELVRNHPNEITLVTLGPLTNVEVASERAPEFLDLLNGLICLGGSMAVGGDVSAAAEFNIYANPEAARNVLRSPATKTLVPLDVSRSAVLTFEQFNRITSTGPSRTIDFLNEVLPYSFRAYHEHLGQEGIFLDEVVAVAAISRPRLFERRGMAIDVETAGELTRGSTVFDRRRLRQWQANIDVLDDVDPQGVLDYFSGTVQRRFD